MWEICENKLLPKALKSCPKSNKLPNLVTLDPAQKYRITRLGNRLLLLLPFQFSTTLKPIKNVLLIFDSF